MPFLFLASIAANIIYSLSEKSPLCFQANIDQAVRASGIYSFIQSLSDGYNTMVGDGGQVLSGDQV
ncbi:hypothetical protein F4825DRAFT_304279 [Nemania diffusa]|nr:hypothetical protein F4825DRAFT_304279 [Nemania diffusa]